MAWIESHQSLSRHRKTLRAVALLRVDRHKFLGHMHELWWWGLDNVPKDGCLDGLSDEEIAEGAQWRGSASTFVQALVTSEFIDVDETGQRWLHDWYDYAGKLLTRREKNRDRMRHARAPRDHEPELAHAEHVQGTCETRAPATVPNRTQPYSTEESPNGDSGTSVPSPPPISPVPVTRPSEVSLQVAEVWAYYQEHIQPKARVCPEAKIRTRLKRFSVAELKEAIDRFKANHWWMTHNAKQGGEWFFSDNSQIDRFLLLEPETEQESERRERRRDGEARQHHGARDGAPASGGEPWTPQRSPTLGLGGGLPAMQGGGVPGRPGVAGGTP